MGLRLPAPPISTIFLERFVTATTPACQNAHRDHCAWAGNVMSKPAAIPTPACLTPSADGACDAIAVANASGRNAPSLATAVGASVARDTLASVVNWTNMAAALLPAGNPQQPSKLNAGTGAPQKFLVAHTPHQCGLSFTFPLQEFVSPHKINPLHLRWWWREDCTFFVDGNPPHPGHSRGCGSDHRLPTPISSFGCQMAGEDGPK